MIFKKKKGGRERQDIERRGREKIKEKEKERKERKRERVEGKARKKCDGK